MATATRPDLLTTARLDTLEQRVCALERALAALAVHRRPRVSAGTVRRFLADLIDVLTDVGGTQLTFNAHDVVAHAQRDPRLHLIAGWDAVRVGYLLATAAQAGGLRLVKRDSDGRVYEITRQTSR